MAKLFRYASILMLSALLVGCSALDMIPTGGTSVNTNAQVGQENTQQVVGNQTKVAGNQSRDLIETNQGSLIVNNSPIWLVVLAIAGWVLPTPLTMIKSLWKNTFGRRNKDGKARKEGQD